MEEEKEGCLSVELEAVETEHPRGGGLLDRNDNWSADRTCDKSFEGSGSFEERRMNTATDAREHGFGHEILDKEGAGGAVFAGSFSPKSETELHRLEGDTAEPRNVADLMEKDDTIHNKQVADVVDDSVLDFLKASPGNDDGTLEEQISFVRELENFFSERKMEYKHPKFYGENLNCLKLWRAVVRLGGYESVTNGKLWRQVGETFNPPKTCTTVSWSFRGFYEKALLDYEKFKLHGIQPNAPQGVLQTEASLQGGEGPTTISVSGSLQPCPGALPASGRARRDAAARAMQGWHSQRFLGNGEVGDPIIKDKTSSSAAKREKQLKNIGILKKKKPSSLERAVKAARTKGIRSQFQDDIFDKDENGDDVGRPSIVTTQKKKIIKPDHSRQLMKSNSYYNTMDVLIVDEGPPADWVKINVHKTRDCFEVYALVPGLLREEVRIQCEPGGQLVITGEPEQPDNPWGVTPFKKVVNLPLSIDVHQTSAVVTLHGQLFVRVPYAQQSL